MSAVDLPIAVAPWARPLASGSGAFLVVVALTPPLTRLAVRSGWVAEPTEDRWHRERTALLGGLAIYAGTAAVWILLVQGGGLRALFAAGSVMFAAGLADDLRGLSPVAKLVLQATAATVVVAADYRFAAAWPDWLSIPLTYVWLIGITNAVNLLDNMDGLAAGIACIAAATVAVLFAVDGAWPAAAPAMAVAGAAAGFLVYNHPPARIFMGDGGSLFLGITLATLVLASPGAAGSGPAALAVPAAVMAVPILDTSLVTVKRIAAGRPITRGGRDHSSHRLVALGLSERRAVWTLYGLAAVFSTLAVALQVVDGPAVPVLAGLAATALAGFGAFLARARLADHT